MSMARVIALDAGPLGLACSAGGGDAGRCLSWIRGLSYAGAVIIVPEIADFEIRRELIRLGKSAAVARLDRLITEFLFAPITRASMLKAAELWADVRRRGIPTADPLSLDADCIVAAQALLACGHGDVLTIATSNPDHLVRFGVDARTWERI